MWPCLLFYSQGLALYLAHTGTQGISAKWMSISQETSRCIHSCNYLLSAYCEPGTRLGTGRTTVPTLIWTMMMVTERTTASDYWTFTMCQASGWLLLFSCNPLPKTHMAGTIILPTVHMKVIYMDLHVNKSLTLKCSELYIQGFNSHQLRKGYLWIHSCALLSLWPKVSLLTLHLVWNLL